MQKFKATLPDYSKSLLESEIILLPSEPSLYYNIQDNLDSNKVWALIIIVNLKQDSP